MNCLLVLPSELHSATFAVLLGSRAQHAIGLHALAAGLRVRAAVLGGKRGSAVVKSANSERVELELELPLDPFPRRDLRWIVGISRPPTIKKVVQLAAVLGVARLDFLRTSNTEKSYLQSPALTPDNLQAEVLKGLEQSGDSLAPDIEVHRYFKPFIEDRLREVCADSWKVIADTRATKPFSALSPSKAAVSLAVGPEAGWSEQEVALFTDAGFEVAHFGERAVRVETAVLYATAFVDGLKSRP